MPPSFTARRLLGLALLALPFIAITVYAVVTLSWLAAASIWGLVLAILGTIGAGVHLLDG